MAEFSKQYCESDDEGFLWDFDILAVAESIPNNRCVHIICEGYGFVAIGKDDSGKIILAFIEKDEIVWKPYHEVVVQ